MGYINKQYQTHGQNAMADYKQKLCHDPLRSNILHLLQCIKFVEQKEYSFWDPGGVEIPILVPKHMDKTSIVLEYDNEAGNFVVYIMNSITGDVIMKKKNDSMIQTKDIVMWSNT